MVDLFELDLEYERANNCMNKHGGVLTGAGVFPDSVFWLCGGGQHRVVCGTALSF